MLDGCTVGGKVTGSDVEGPVTVPEGDRSQGGGRLPNRDRAQVGLAGESRSDGKAADAASRSRFARRFLEPHMSRNFFLGGELVGAEEAASEIDDGMSEMMTASTGS